jgi:hypothetical protein
MVYIEDTENRKATVPEIAPERPPFSTPGDTATMKPSLESGIHV